MKHSFCAPHYLLHRAAIYAGLATVIVVVAVATVLAKGSHMEFAAVLQHLGTALAHLLTDTTAAEITAGVIFKAVGGGH